MSATSNHPNPIRKPETKENLINILARVSSGLLTGKTVAEDDTGSVSNPPMGRARKADSNIKK
jgi:hypothetical protein